MWVKFSLSPDTVCYKRKGIKISWSTRARCYDNILAEQLLKTLMYKGAT